MSQNQIQLLVEEILKVNGGGDDNSSCEGKGAQNKISEIIQKIEIKEEEIPQFKFVIESLIEMSTKPNPPLAFSQIIKDLHSNENLYPCYYLLSTDLFPAEQFDEETSKIMKFFHENVEKYSLHE